MWQYKKKEIASLNMYIRRFEFEILNFEKDTVK